MYTQSGLPLHWPRELGGWGLPTPAGPRADGEKVDPILAKGLAVLLTSNAEQKKEGLRRIALAFTTSHLNPAAAACIRKATNMVDHQTTNEGHELKPRNDLMAEVTAEAASFFSIQTDLEKVLVDPPAPKMGTIANQVRKILTTYAEQWKSVKPIQLPKAKQLLEHAQSWRLEPLRADQIDSIMHWAGCQIRYFRVAVAKNLSPFERLHLVRTQGKTKNVVGATERDTQVAPSEPQSTTQAQSTQGAPAPPKSSDPQVEATAPDSSTTQLPVQQDSAGGGSDLSNRQLESEFERSLRTRIDAGRRRSEALKARVMNPNWRQLNRLLDDDPVGLRSRKEKSENT
jgi:hypothetical protein